MIYDGVIQGEKVFLRNVELSDCTDRYLNWLNDIRVNRYLETRWHKQSIEGIKQFVESIRTSDHSYLFAIIESQNNKHIGNIKIGPINPQYSYADVSYFIGEVEYWGKGIATEAIALVTNFGFTFLNLNRIQAGAFGKNYGSIKALQKAGFVIEGCLREQLKTNDSIDDHIYLGILNKEWIRK